MGFTNFNMVQFPQFVGLSNFYSLILEDEVFLKAIQNTLVFAIITGPLSYIMCFILAWLINEMPRALKTIFTFIFYAPTLAGNIYTTWQLIFSGDTYGIANSYLLDLGIINSARQWLTDANYIMGVVIVVQLWMSLGAGFLALREVFRVYRRTDTRRVLSKASRTVHSSYCSLRCRQWALSCCSQRLCRSPLPSQPVM